MIDKELDRVKLQLFLGTNAAFYGPLMCSLDFLWDESISTACINALKQLKINPSFFMKLGVESRKTVLIHEIDHLARLHHLRAGNRDHELWNTACDHEINLQLEKDGFSFAGIESAHKDPAFDGMSAEEIYDILEQQQSQQQSNQSPPPPHSWEKGDGGDLSNEGTGQPTDDEDSEGSGSDPLSDPALKSILDSVVQAHASASMSNNYSSSLSQAVRERIDKYLKSRVEWNKVLRKYFMDRMKRKYSWRRRNRRYKDIYLPKRMNDGSSLSHIAFFLDSSGSTSKKTGQIFNSEIKFIKDFLDPEKLTVSQFDTQIHNSKTFHRHDRYENLEIVGRGGTDLQCVRDYILEHKPNVAVIMTDLWCAPMEPVKGTDLVWIVIDNPSAQVIKGKVIHITERD